MSNRQLQLPIIFTVFGLGVFIMMLAHYESAENWGLWMFTRIFSEGNGFIIPERSPIYVVYLLPFYLIGYPESMVVEWFVTSVFVAISLYLFLKPHLGSKLSIFTVLLWLPFIRFSEPAVQSHALALSCLAMLLRSKRNEGNTRLKWAFSYALFGLAYMFRMTYIFFIVVFVAYDLIVLYRKTGFKSCAKVFLPKVDYWPIGVVILLLISFNVFQSSHSWNNAWFCTTTWFPTDGKTLRDASFVQVFNWEYIRLKYGTFEGHDFYFTNQEAFNGANTLIGGMLANPQFVFAQWGRNILNLFHLSIFFIPLNWLTKLVLPSFLSFIPIVIFALFGAYKAARKETDLIIFIIVSILCLGTVAISMPKLRYLVPIVPIIVLSAWWYGTQIKIKLIPAIFKNQKNLLRSGLIIVALVLIGYFLSPLRQNNPSLIFRLLKYSLFILVILTSVFLIANKIKFQSKLNGWIELFAKFLAVPLVIIFFSRPILWGKIVKDISEGDFRIMEYRVSTSWITTFREVDPLIKNCKGVMTAEYRFMGAFSNLPLDRIYDIWEIPPFGDLNDSVYTGLRTDRIDCLMVSDNFAYGGYGTPNERLRYQYYVEPYIKVLQKFGAKTYNIKNYGRVIILINSN